MKTTGISDKDIAFRLRKMKFSKTEFQVSIIKLPTSTIKKIDNKITPKTYTSNNNAIHSASAEIDGSPIISASP